MADNRSATPADVEKSIQIALDAADAAMDVTSEYAKVAQQIKKSTAKLNSIEKFGRIGVIVGLVGGLGVAALSLVMFLQASSKLKVLTQTNTELLTIFVENVDNFNEELEFLDPALSNIEKLKNSVDKLGNTLKSYGDRSNSMSKELRVAIEKMNEIEPIVQNQVTEFRQHNSIMNSELTLSLAEMTTEEFKAQNMIMGNFTRSVIEALQTISDDAVDIKEQRASLQALQEVNANLSARIATLDQRLQNAKREAERVRASATMPKKQKSSGDIIKYP